MMALYDLESLVNAEPVLKTGQSEPELIARILQGERALFHDLLRPYDRAVYFTAYAVLHNHADAEEAAQETMIKALTRLDQLSSAAKFKSWLLQIAMNEARLKRRSRRDHLYEPIESERDQEEGFMPRDLADWREVPPEHLERKEIREAIARALIELPEIYREIFVLRDVQELSVAECAQMLDVSQETVKVRLHRARLMMREKLSPVFKRGFLERWLSFKGNRIWLLVSVF